jgi:H+/gluconate symporter-like permease
MYLLVNILCFVLGLITATAAMVFWALWLKKKDEQFKHTADTQKTNKTDKLLSIQKRLKEADEIAVKQNKIDTRLGPNFVMQFNELELQKLSVLKSVITDGFDPIITIVYGSGPREMLLSTYVQSIQKGLV